MNKYFLLFIFILFVWGFFIEPNLLVVKHYTINGLGKKKIVFISDFHISKWDKKRLQRIVKLVNSQNPDLVLSGGDYIKGHNDNSSLSIEEQAKILSQIKAPVVSVLGNHDGWYDKYAIKTTLENIGFTVLSNNSTKIDNLYIAGVEDLQTGYPNPQAALENTNHPRILLTHNPDIYYDIKEDVDLILAGHVHGGQVRFPFIGSTIVPSKYGARFACGKYKETQNTMIVTKGLGTSILNVRFLTLPEIVVLESN